MRAGLTISSAFHAAILGWGLIHFASPKPLEAPPVEAFPIDLISVSELTQMRAGKKKPEKAPDPVKPVEKKDEPKTIEDLTRPIKEKEVKAAPPPPEAAPPPVAEAPPKPEEAKPDPKEGPTPAPQKQQPKKVEKQEKKEDKKEAKVKTLPAPTKRKFDPDQIASLLDRRDPSRKKSSGQTPANAPLGVNRGDSQNLSVDEMHALARHVEKCWNVLPGVGNVERSMVELRIQMNLDGTLAAPPQVLNRGTGPSFQATAESAVRAVIACQPYKMLSAKKYDAWKDMIFNFAPPDGTRS